MLTLSSSRSLVVGLSVRRFYLCDSSDSGHQNKSPKKKISLKTCFTITNLSPKKHFHKKKFYLKTFSPKIFSPNKSIGKTQILTSQRVKIVTKLK